MVWLLLLAALAFLVALRQKGRRRTVIGRSQSISTLNVVMSKKQTGKTKSALDAATASLR